MMKTIVCWSLSKMEIEASDKNKEFENGYNTYNFQNKKNQKKKL